MKKALITAISIMGLILFLNSCSDDDPVKPTPNPTIVANNYFPVTVGSWWQYQNHEFNKDGTIDDAKTYDYKMVSNKIEVKAGKTSAVFQIQDLNGNKIEDNQFYFTTKEQIWSYTKLLPTLPFTLPISLTDSWFKVGDEKGTEWVLHTEYLKNVSIEFSGVTIILDDTLKITMKNEGIQSVNYGANNDITVDAIVYKKTVSYGGNAKFAGIVQIQIPFDVVSYYYYAEGIGLVRSELKPFAVSYSGMGISNDGNEQILIEKEIK